MHNNLEDAFWWRSGWSVMVRRDIMDLGYTADSDQQWAWKRILYIEGDTAHVSRGKLTRPIQVARCQRLKWKCA